MGKGSEKPQLVPASQGEGSEHQDYDAGPNWETQEKRLLVQFSSVAQSCLTLWDPVA